MKKPAACAERYLYPAKAQQVGSSWFPAVSKSYPFGFIP